MTPVRILLVLAGGITTARNIPYSATFRALKRRAGSSSPETAPSRVPRVQPGTATQISP